MSQSIIQALQGLVPTLSGPLPAELVSLAESLLAQSRTKASTLKAEEEIARSYACANIACERLKQHLSLPKIEPRPPCPPRTYQKFYEQLNHVLSVKAFGYTKKTSQEGGEIKTNRRTPQKPGSSNPSRTVSSRTTTSANKFSQLGEDDEPPQWVMHVIRRLCRGLKAPAAAPHVFAGVSSILLAEKRKGGSRETPDDIVLAALISAVAFFVSSRLAGVQIKSEELVQKMNTAQATMKQLADEGFDITEIDEPQIRAHMRMIASQKWIQMDWFRNVKVGSGVNGQQSDSQSQSEGDNTISHAKEASSAAPQEQPKTVLGKSDVEYLQPGLGTMMQPRVDYLSDESLKAYEEWKADILRRLDDRENASEEGEDLVDAQKL